MGYVIPVGRCICCGRHFAFNPDRVPSLVIDGEREPVCRTCVERVNPIRKRNGLPEITPLPGAYEPAPEADDRDVFQEGGT